MKTIRVNPSDYYDVYIGRPSKWGNPFMIGKDGTRTEVIEKFRNWIVNQKELMESLTELKGKKLRCWCLTKENCHGDILITLINAQANEDIIEY